MLCGLAAGAIKVGGQWIEVWCHHSKDHEQVGDGACQSHQTDLILAMVWALESSSEPWDRPSSLCCLRAPRSSLDG